MARLVSYIPRWCLSVLALGLASGGDAWAESDKVSLGLSDEVKLKEAGKNYSAFPPSQGLGFQLYPSPIEASSQTELQAAWGVDACLSGHVPPEQVPEWLALLKQSGVRILRDRDTGRHAFDPALHDVKPVYSQEKAAGFMVVAFGRETAALPGVDKRWGVSTDLAAVFAEGRRIGRDFATVVDVWELHNEPDLGYVPDLHDRYTAHAKALYLGLKEGAREAGKDTPVILGALGLPPGTWLARAAQNDLLDYADAYNFHYYGNPDDLASVIDAHREAMRVSFSSKFMMTMTGRPVDRSGFRPSAGFRPPARRTLPMWITECGLDAMIRGDFFNEERRAYQAEFTVATARQALAAPDVAVFMPFILVHKGDPHAMVVAENVAPLPAWDAYAAFTRENPWPRRKLFDPAGGRASPVVLQWLPDAGTRSHKVAGTYRLRDGEALSGEFRVYNFSDREVTGELLMADARGLRAEIMPRKSGLQGMAASGSSSLDLKLSVPTREALRIPAGGSAALPVRYTPRTEDGYFREWTTARFREQSGRVSRVAFGVERHPEEPDFKLDPVAVYPLIGDSRVQPPHLNVEGASTGTWRVFNGLQAREPRGDGGRKAEAEDLKPEAGDRTTETGGRQAEGGDASDFHASGFKSQVFAPRVRFSVEKPANDPLAPTYAVAALRGVPGDARFLRLRLDRPMSASAGVRVDLIDEDGQRFTIWENLGQVQGESSSDVWLALEDFHPYSWSRLVPDKRRLRPDKIREISLRVYLRRGGSIDVELEWAKEKAPGAE